MEGLQSGTVLATVTAKDPDEGENGTVYYSLSGECISARPPTYHFHTHAAVSMLI